ncbi:class I SAM-dependent methyltransferase [Thiorhodovibrio frisius]|uniref:class I SAM-dependent methyltransferase n=1 Tax=Thiorhodovibrio frisius TaxID=631362 RepID=UPI00022C6545|nr:methyltransferase domain-containing protein [Thiorhodovibrio frisius]WPL19992.1 Methyltransferase domain protein [Thiorhodovibrio frisius]
MAQVYDEWYALIIDALPARDDVLELGSGAGFLSELLPGLITSEVFSTPNAKCVLDASRLPFSAHSLNAIVMTDVFHHIPDVRLFFHEAVRCVRPGGRVLMIEPWRTPWSEWVYTHLHHEPFLPKAKQWSLPPGQGPLSAANGALPWLVFQRDQRRFKAEFPALRNLAIKPLMPLAYLLSGGVSMRSLMPGWAYPWIRRLERTVGENRWAMFAFIVLERRST